VKRIWTRVSIALLLLLVVGAGVSRAQSVRTDIPFQFYAGDKVMPAGKYEIARNAAGPITLTGPSNARVMMSVLTYLGRHDSDAEPELIFDKIKGEMHLSEIWLPGQDGLLLLGTKEQHDHEVLGPGRKKK